MKMKPIDMLQLRLGGYTYAYIASKAGISRQRVQQILSPPAEIRDMVVGKAGGFCQICGVRVGVSGHVHHTKAAEPTELDRYNDPESLILLCCSCHRKEHPMPKQDRGSVSVEEIPMSITERLKRCHRCGHEWLAYVSRPQKCPSCQAKDWDKTNGVTAKRGSSERDE